MRYLCVLPFVAFALVPAGAAPVPKHLMKRPGAGHYFPTTPGTKLVYDNTTLVVANVETRGGTKVVTVDYDTGGCYHVVEVSASGVVRTQSGSVALDVPYVLMRSPVEPGDSWQVKTPNLEGTKTVGAVETVKVPAGTFEAVRVDTDYVSQGRRYKNVSWYAPGLGLVKSTTDGAAGWQLQSFAPGKE
ncbi:MAG TPA: hypothetical protein VGE74_04885 [Gemmata sp.]